MRAAMKQGEERQKSSRAALAQYYLLDGDFRVISAKTDEENTELGAFFFDLFPAKRALVQEIDAYARSLPHRLLLALCTRTPVLLAGSLFAHTGTLFAVVPRGEIKRTLASPAAFHGVPAPISVSTYARMHYKAHDEAAFGDACRWLLGIATPFWHREGQELCAVLGSCADALSSMLNVPLCCDLSGLPALSCTGLDVDFGVGVMLSALFAAARSAHTGGVRLYAAMEGAPTLYLEYVRADLSKDIPEFVPLLGCAEQRGMILDVVHPIEEPSLVQVRVMLRVAELSEQELRERNRFLEGKSVLCTLPQSRAIAPAFPELSFD